jgi:hypothetical protein
VQEQGDFGFWPEIDGAVGVITPQMVRDMCSKRLLYADLLSHSEDPEVAHAAKMVSFTIEGIQRELLEFDILAN